MNFDGVAKQVFSDMSVTTSVTVHAKPQKMCGKPCRHVLSYGNNSAILSRLLTKYEASGNAKAVVLITQLSPAAWRHILLNGHYAFQNGGMMIDLDALLDGLELG